MSANCEKMSITICQSLMGCLQMSFVSFRHNPLFSLVRVWKVMSLSQHMDLPAIDLICLQGVLLEEYRLYNTETYLEPAWFSMRYQVAEKFSLVKSPLIPGNVTSMSFCGILPLGEDR